MLVRYLRLVVRFELTDYCVVDEVVQVVVSVAVVVVLVLEVEFESVVEEELVVYLVQQRLQQLYY